ncbi:type II toxin-antitoxin system VapC family toxin [Phocoenobacter atlanticus]|uniref:type II toxin-antitoxin system VapC family toxin n=1 Tax=Phocoenobacter atlanticus TaxID=3416742 RepID=UPI00276AFBE0|nr:type II toxin-antitoxin system VapC family toxin [Pasteurella atlantica]MDP8101626.1 type II toxin-antitoxin system VapC family toxin [Pasteurella atlantica]
MFLLDTNLISEIRKIKQGKANPNVVDWFKNNSIEDFYTNPTVLMEIQRGILRKKYKDPKQFTALTNWYQNNVLKMLNGRILNITPKTAEICAKLHIPDPSPENDAWIAASAIEHNLILVTRNTKDFEGLGIKLFNPFVEHSK